jgi:hypothetical protein
MVVEIGMLNMPPTKLAQKAQCVQRHKCRKGLPIFEYSFPKG